MLELIIIFLFGVGGWQRERTQYSFFYYLFSEVLFIFIESFEVLQWRNISNILKLSDCSII